MAGQGGFVDTDERPAWLSAAGDPLERLTRVVDFELFRPAPEAGVPRSDRSKGGRPPYDAVPMFRVLVVQTLYALSDDQAEHRIRDRLSFMRFVGLALRDAVPDAKTIWLYRGQLVRAGAFGALFARFDAGLRAKGYLAMGGQVVDATVIEARRPRLGREEKETIEGGGVPEDRSPARRAQIDTEGRWTIKRGRKREAPGGGQARQAQGEIAVPMFGYRNHLGIDRAYGFVRRFVVTRAARHDGSQPGALLDRSNLASGVWADTACRSKANPALLERRGFFPEVRRPERRGRPIPAHIRRGNATRAKIRAHVEHVFAAEKHRFKLPIRTVGLARAKIALATLADNFKRLAWIEGKTAPA